MKFHILIYGCQMNYYDSARIRAVLENLGFEYTSDIQESDIVIFDTCSVRQKAEDKIFGKLKEIPQEKRVWITGCMVGHNLKLPEKNKGFARGNFVGNETEKVSIAGMHKEYQVEGKGENYVYINHVFDPFFSKIKKNFDNLELAFRIDDVAFLPMLLTEFGYSVESSGVSNTDELSLIPEGSNQLFSSSSKTAFVPIQMGCNQFCSYCIVPYARGLERNRDKEEVITEVESHLQNGVEEIMLIGQIVNKHPDFSDILSALLQKDGLKRLRYTSPYPDYYTEEIFRLHENNEKLCPHIHIPLQSGSDEILKKMFRGYTQQQFRDFIDNIRSLNKDISITTDVIVGFPDETEEDFRKTLEMIEYARFDMIYIGIYSPRPGTYAYRKYSDNVSTELKKQRWAEVNNLLKQISYENNKMEEGKEKDVMITRVDESVAIGYDEKFKNVLVDYIGSENLKAGDFVKVRITEGRDLKLRASLF